MDVKEIFEVIMPKKEFTKEEVVAIIKQKHRAQLPARKSHHRRNRKQRRGNLVFKFCQIRLSGNCVTWMDFELICQITIDKLCKM